jgi:hypothetical protein
MYIHAKTEKEGFAIIKIIYDKGWKSRYLEFNSGYWNLYKEKTLIEFADNFEWTSIDYCRGEYISCDKFLLEQSNTKPIELYVKSKKELDIFHYHEAQDRLYTILHSINDQILDHPVFINDKSLSDKLEIALNILIELNQSVSSSEELLIQENAKK